MTDELRPATVAEIAESLRYSLRFGPQGKAHGKRTQADLAEVAGWAAQHLLMSGFVVLKKIPPPEPTDRCGAPPGLDQP